MSCFINFSILGILLVALVINFWKRKKVLFFSNPFLNFLFLVIFFLFVFLSGQGIYNLIRYNSCQKPKVIIGGEAGPLAPEGKCPFDPEGEILCIFMDNVVLKRLNLPEPQNENIARVYRKLPTILQWRVMSRAYQKLSPEKKEEFVKFLREADGYNIQLLFYQNIPDYKTIIDEEVEKLRKEALETIYEEKADQ